MTYSVKELADLAGVTGRTIRYYDEIGLLAPAKIGENGYRYYDQESLLRLQQILFFRELDVPLKEIEHIMNLPQFNLLESLQDHQAALNRRVLRLQRLIETVDETIATLKGEWTMKDQDYFEGFDEAQYEAEAKERWGHTPQYAESHHKWSSYSKHQKEAIKAEGGEITLRMVGGDPSIKPDDPEVQAAVAEYYTYLNKYFYTCDVEFLRNLSEMWVADPRFTINYERVREGGAEFVKEAVRVFCDRWEDSR